MGLVTCQLNHVEFFQSGILFIPLFKDGKIIVMVQTTKPNHSKWRLILCWTVHLIVSKNVHPPSLGIKTLISFCRRYKSVEKIGVPAFFLGHWKLNGSNPTSAEATRASSYVGSAEPGFQWLGCWFMAPNVIWYSGVVVHSCCVLFPHHPETKHFRKIQLGHPDDDARYSGLNCLTANWGCLMPFIAARRSG